MEDEASKSSEPAWLDPSNDRKTPYSDAELDRLTDDQIAMLGDTPAWRNLVAEVGMQRARDVVKQRLAGRDPNSLIKWQPSGALHWSAIRGTARPILAMAGTDADGRATGTIALMKLFVWLGVEPDERLTEVVQGGIKRREAASDIHGAIAHPLIAAHRYPPEIFVLPISDKQNQYPFVVLRVPTDLFDDQYDHRVAGIAS